MQLTTAELLEHVTRRLRTASEGVLYLGTAQENFTTVLTVKRRNPATGQTFPWQVRAVLAKVCYWYIVDEDPARSLSGSGATSYPVKVCLSRHGFLLRSTSHWTTVCSRAPMRHSPSASPAGGTSGPLLTYSTNGYLTCRTRFPPPTARRVMITTCPSFRPSSRSPRCSTGLTLDQHQRQQRVGLRS